MNTDYTKKVIEHFQHPRNMGEMENPDAVGEKGNPMCGDVMKIYLKIKDEKIKDIKFQTMGCAAAISTSSILTELVKGKTIEQAKQIKHSDIVNALGGLPKIKVHCSGLGVETLKDAIKNWEEKNGL